jgi:membrane associated rhomboid family serine protease
MSPWTCGLLITLAGAMGGVVSAMLADKGLTRPKLLNDIWCPGFIGNVLMGALAAFASWAFYGSGAAIDLALTTERNQISLRFSALAGAFLVGVVGAKWIASEVDKKLLKETVREVAKKRIPEEVCEDLLNRPARPVLEAVKIASGPSAT